MHFNTILPLVAAFGASVVTAAECELTSTMNTLKKIAQLPSVAQCGAASGFSLSTPEGKPTLAQLDKICSSSACLPAVGVLLHMELPSCTISMLNNVNVREIAEGISKYCQSVATNEAAVVVAGAAPSTDVTPTPVITTMSPSGVTSNGQKKRLRKNCHS